MPEPEFQKCGNSFPKKMYFFGGGLGGGLVLSLGIMYLIAFNDKSLRTEKDVELCLRLPVLTMLPDFENADSESSIPLRADGSWG